jgi:hypothetical protein
LRDLNDFNIEREEFAPCCAAHHLMGTKPRRYAWDNRRDYLLIATGRNDNARAALTDDFFSYFAGLVERVSKR